MPPRKLSSSRTPRLPSIDEETIEETRKETRKKKKQDEQYKKDKQ